MAPSWAALRKTVIEEAKSPETRKAFENARQHHASLGCFSDPAELITFLRSPRTTLDDKDEALGALVRIAQTGDEKRAAIRLLWAALWPGLNGIHRRLHSAFQNRSHALTSAISVGFTDCVRELRLDRVRRIACALVKGTKRTVLFELELNGRFAHPDENDPASIATPCGTSLLCHEAQIAALGAWLAPLAGPDTDLLIDSLVFELSNHEVAARHGLTVAAVRQRRWRAIRKLRVFLSDSLAALPPGQEVDDHVA
jgi:hypothetical protein